jgi:hypothetical protein
VDTRKSNNHGLEQAMTLLVQNQAAFLSHLTETRQRMVDLEEDIRTEFRHIKAILLRHEQTLNELPEAIRKKIV